MADILPFAIPHGRLRAVVQPELGERGSEQNLHGPGSYVELSRYRLVRSPRSGQHAEYVTLAAGEIGLIWLGTLVLSAAVWTAAGLYIARLALK